MSHRAKNIMLVMLEAIIAFRRAIALDVRVAGGELFDGGVQGVYREASL
jgi:hypothetical protein